MAMPASTRDELPRAAAASAERVSSSGGAPAKSEVGAAAKARALIRSAGGKGGAPAAAREARPDPVRVLQELQKSFGNAYAQKVVQSYRGQPGAKEGGAKQTKASSTEKPGAKARVEARGAPSPETLAALLVRGGSTAAGGADEGKGKAPSPPGAAGHGGTGRGSVGVLGRKPAPTSPGGAARSVPSVGAKRAAKGEKAARAKGAASGPAEKGSPGKAGDEKPAGDKPARAARGKGDVPAEKGDAPARKGDAPAGKGDAPAGKGDAPAGKAAAGAKGGSGAAAKAPASPKGKPALRQDAGGGPIAGAGGRGGGGGGGGAKSPRSPEEDPAFQKVKQKALQTGAKQAAHPSGASKADAAQGAALGPANEVSSKAGAAQAGEMDAQQPKPFDRAGFKAALMAKIAELTPKTLEDADKFKDSGKTGELKGAVTGEVSAGKDQSQGDIKAKTEASPNTSGVTAKPVTPLPASDPGTSPGSVGATAAAPKPKTDAEVSMKDGSKKLDDEWKKTELEDKDVAKSNEPKFQKVADSKKKAQKDAEERPKQYRSQEQAVVAQAQQQAEVTAQVGVQGMHASRIGATNKVASGQSQTKSKDEKERARIHGEMQVIFERTKTAVTNRLQKLDTDVNAAFDQGADDARKQFDTYVDTRMRAYKADRYGGFGGGAFWLKDKLFGMPDEVNAFYEEGRQLYVDKMEAVIDKVSLVVETGLAEAKKLIAQGKQEIDGYVNGLDPSLRQMGKEEGDKFQSQFSDLENAVEEKANGLVDALAQKYVERLNKLDDDIKALKEANKGLVDAVVGAIKEMINTIIALKNLLLNVLAKAAAAIKKIIKDPIGFLGNLVAGVKAGILGFKDKIGQYLQEGLMGWLFGALGSAGITMPSSFDLKGILSLVMQVLGLTYANIRARAVAIVGEPVVKALETTAEIFKILITEGPAGLWKYIQEQIGNLKEMFIEGIKTFIIEKIIVAGITWLISMLNPASAFIKACKMIVDVVIFFVQRASQIMTLVNAVIDSVSAIADGNIAVAANLVEQALARAVPVVLSFLAALLGLGGISGKIRSIIEKIRAPINKAIDWVIRKAVAMVKALGKLFGVGKKEDKPGDDKWNAAVAALRPDLEKLKKEGVTEKKLNSTLPGLRAKHGFRALTIKSTARGWQIIGSMSPEKPIEEVEYAGSQKDPFDLDWPKPAAAGYPVLFFGGPSVVGIPQSVLATQVGQEVNGHKVRAFNPIGGGTLPGGGGSVGITTTLAVGTVIGPVGSGSTPGGGRINKVFHPYGFRAQSEGLDGDHVQEIQLGGHDVIGNLWPLQKGMNRGAGSSLAQKTLTHPKLSDSVKMADLKADTAHKYWFRIKSTR